MSKKDNPELEAAVTRIRNILISHDIEMGVGGCCCCGSPWVTFKYKGETILDCQDDCPFSTNKDKDSANWR